MRVNTMDKVISGEREELRKAQKARKNKKHEKHTKLRRFFAGMFTLGSIGIITGLTLLYGPWSNFREWLITTAMTTMTRKFNS